MGLNKKSVLLWLKLDYKYIYIYIYIYFYFSVSMSWMVILNISRCLFYLYCFIIFVNKYHWLVLCCTEALSSFKKFLEGGSFWFPVLKRNRSLRIFLDTEPAIRDKSYMIWMCLLFHSCLQWTWKLSRDWWKPVPRCILEYKAFTLQYLKCQNVFYFIVSICITTDDPW